jgi:hypothetical protein
MLMLIWINDNPEIESIIFCHKETGNFYLYFKKEAQGFKVNPYINKKGAMKIMDVESTNEAFKLVEKYGLPEC